MDEVHSSNEVAIRVLHKQRGTDSVWSLDTLEEKVLTMRDMYERMEEGDSLLLVRGWVLIGERSRGHCIDLYTCSIAHHSDLVSFQDESLGPDPFYDLEQHALLGVANIFMECLYHSVVHEYDAPIVAPTGKVTAWLVLGSLIPSLRCHSLIPSLHTSLIPSLHSIASFPVFTP